MIVPKNVTIYASSRPDFPINEENAIQFAIPHLNAPIKVLPKGRIESESVNNANSVVGLVL
jgi:hypothetical protein